MDFFKKRKATWSKNAETMGYFVKRYWALYLTLLGIISVFEIIMIIRGIIIFDFHKTRHILYLSSYSLLFIASLAASIIIIIVKKKNLDNRLLFYMLDAYAFIVIIWSTIISYLDMANSGFPIVYLTIVVIMAGVVVIDPVFYSLLIIFSSGTLLILGRNYEVITSVGDYFNIIVFVIMSAFVAYRNYSVSISEANSRSHLRHISRTDSLTDLGNETLYFETVDKLNKKLAKNPNIKFGIVVMDLNNLKATNDAFGHKYGCHLVVKTGHTLPKIFKTSNLFHIGGDEFVAIIQNDDYENINSCLELFESKLEYSTIKYEGKELIHSVAYGYAKYESGMRYQDVFQLADDRMYEHKAGMKQKYNFPLR